MNNLNVTSMMGTGGDWGMGANMAFHGLTWLILILAIGTVVWLLARMAGRAVVNRRE